ncbi:prokineticin Bv8-like peptide 2 [Lingula anatina]|uniref:Prokineticin Bv8-like peptide 2 n=1 Tax=Lingula anatina TaxID=7574 RepID=A0A1S3JLR6_LINAN|nr:prokineticin Bv8-like peptide 2 [Lingula anatina]|eukprot:XP_013411355.1 prokineticin Bv8-like peptide 2 [Lingula anatina]
MMALIKGMLLIVFLSCLILCSQGEVKQCTRNIQCLPRGLCCESGNLVRGKRALSLLGGKCAQYKEEGERCHRNNVIAEPSEMEMLCPCRYGLTCEPNNEMPPVYGNCVPIK